MNTPKLKKVAGGWLAINDVRGDEWAVLAPTQEEALHSFYLKFEKYRKIDARPFKLQASDDYNEATA